MTRSHCTAPAEEQTALEERERERESIRRGQSEHEGGDARFLGKCCVNLARRNF